MSLSTILFRSDTNLLSALYKIKLSKIAFYIYKIMKLVFHILTFKLSYGTYRYTQKSFIKIGNNYGFKSIQDIANTFKILKPLPFQRGEKNFRPIYFSMAIHISNNHTVYICNPNNEILFSFDKSSLKRNDDWLYLFHSGVDGKGAVCYKQ